MNHRFRSTGVTPSCLHSLVPPPCPSRRQSQQYHDRQYLSDATSPCFQRIHHPSATRETFLWFLRECFCEHDVHALGDSRHRPHGRGQHGPPQNGQIVAVERQLARKHPIRQHAKGIFIGRCALRIPQPLLWRLVSRSTASRRFGWSRAALARADLGGQAEVKYLYAALVVHHDVLRLHVTMDHLLRMRKIKRCGDLAQN